MTATKFFLYLALLSLAGCAAPGPSRNSDLLRDSGSSREPSPSMLSVAQTGADKSRDTCIDVRKETRSWISTGPNTLLIDQGRFKYEVEVLQCNTAQFDKFSISQGPEKPVLGRDGRFLYASQVVDGRVCGQAGDRLVMRKNTDDFFTPWQTCRISSVRRVNG